VKQKQKRRRESQKTCSNQWFPRNAEKLSNSLLVDIFLVIGSHHEKNGRDPGVKGGERRERGERVDIHCRLFVLYWV
jgi:hypothetical protein